MNQAIYIIGTDHRYQNLSTEFEDAKHREFSEMILDVVIKKGIQLISEENNFEALEENNISKSALQLIANDLNKVHLFTEASREYRKKNEMTQENNLRISGILSNLDEQEIINSIDKSYRNRELYWFNEIQKINIWPALHICGANHAKGFAKLVNNAGLSADILFVDWSN